MNSSYWTQAEGIALCVEIEPICAEHGCHIALTGGLLYGKGPRKDCDLVLYRHDNKKPIVFDPLFAALKAIGIEKLSGYGYYHKAHRNGKTIDFLAKEEEGEYQPEASPDINP